MDFHGLKGEAASHPTNQPGVADLQAGNQGYDRARDVKGKVARVDLPSAEEANTAGPSQVNVVKAPVTRAAGKSKSTTAKGRGVMLVDPSQDPEISEEHDSAAMPVSAVRATPVMYMEPATVAADAIPGHADRPSVNRPGSASPAALLAPAAAALEGPTLSGGRRGSPPVMTDARDLVSAVRTSSLTSLDAKAVGGEQPELRRSRAGNAALHAPPSGESSSESLRRSRAGSAALEIASDSEERQQRPHTAGHVGAAPSRGSNLSRGGQPQQPGDAWGGGAV